MNNLSGFKAQGLNWCWPEKLEEAGDDKEGMLSQGTDGVKA